MEETEELTGWSLFVTVAFDVFKMAVAVFLLWDAVVHHTPDSWFCLMLLILVGAI